MKSTFTFLFFVSLIYAGCEKNKRPTDPGKTLLDPPTLIVEDTSFTGDVLLRWTASKNATGYLLQEDEEVGFSSPVSVYEGAETSATVTGRSFGNVYFYRVQAVQGSLRSNWSIPVAVTIVALPHILVSVESLEFGYTAVGSQRILSFTIDNAGARAFTSYARVD